ncbi:MAG: type II toxin-antitoxin system HicA family toxin [Planctomycetes bacterium]|nr:type II toxin-antitoxin system HicA family toxin [Planctomycetota bacterium]
MEFAYGTKTWYYNFMNSKHRKTLESLFATQTPKTLPFRNIESLLRAIGCEIIEGNGSRVLFTLNGIDWPTHRPHPEKVARPYHVSEVRDYLRQLGVKP